MFTGIVEEVGEVVAAGAGALRIRASRVCQGTKMGDSISIDGVDLTVTMIGGDELQFNVMPETLRRSTLDRVAPGTRVNLERSVRPGDRLSGHVVRGVVEGTGALAGRADDGDALILTFSAPPELLGRMVERGPVCVDGASLTLIRKTDKTFTVSVVAFTQQNTTLSERRLGDAVNIETDILMRYVDQAIAARLRTDGVGGIA